MRVPIASCLAWPERMETPLAPLDLAAIGELTFFAPDEERFLLDLLEALAETCMDFLEQQQHLDRQLYHTVNACLHDYSAAPETPTPLAA